MCCTSAVFTRDMRRLDAEYDNLRAAVRWSLDHDSVKAVVAAGTALTRYGILRVYRRELRGWRQRP